jgi:hypothetical protein
MKSRFVKTGDELRSQDENNTHGKIKHGTKLIFSPKFVLKGVASQFCILPLPAP